MYDFQSIQENSLFWHKLIENIALIGLFTGVMLLVFGLILIIEDGFLEWDAKLSARRPSTGIIAIFIASILIWIC